MSDERHRSALRDSDSVAAAFRLKAIALGMWLGILGMFVGMFVAERTGWNALLCVVVGLVCGSAFAAGIGLLAAGGLGGAARRLFMPGNSAALSRREYSLADAHIARGAFDDAIAELERCAAEYPTDPEPRLRLARLLRDRLRRYDDAIRWFRAALAVPELDPSTDIAATRELAELFTHRLREPRRALPDLARLAQRYADTAAGQWARRELAEIKRAMREEDPLA